MAGARTGLCAQKFLRTEPNTHAPAQPINRAVRVRLPCAPVADGLRISLRLARRARLVLLASAPTLKDGQEEYPAMATAHLPGPSQFGDGISGKKLRRF